MLLSRRNFVLETERRLCCKSRGKIYYTGFPVKQRGIDHNHTSTVQTTANT